MDKIKLIMPSIEYRDVEADFRSIFDSNWFSNGEYGRKFSTSLAEYTGARHAFLTSSSRSHVFRHRTYPKLLPLQFFH